jgi:hypothetical protein
MCRVPGKHQSFLKKQKCGQDSIKDGNLRDRIQDIGAAGDDIDAYIKTISVHVIFDQARSRAVVGMRGGLLRAHV